MGVALLVGTTVVVLPAVGSHPADVAAAASTPAVTAVSPTSGPSSGGTSVTLTGSGFTGATAVDFGSSAATGVSVTSDSSLTATSPALSVSSSTPTTTVDVTVITPSGTSATSTADEFTYTYSSGGATASLSASSTTPTTGQSVQLTATANSAPSSPQTLSIVDETPRPAHVMVIMMENESSTGVIGNSSLPYINNTLAAQYPQLADNYAVAHPSLPNYLELLSGSTQGVTTDCAPGPGCEGTSNLANQLDTAGIGWSAYMEGLPAAGYSGGDTGCLDGDGDPLYFEHHDPFQYFPDLAGDLPTHVKPLSSMVPDLDSPDAPAFVWVTPDVLDDMHDGPLSTGDTWLSQEIPAIQATQWYQQGGQIVLTWDEGFDSDTSGLGGGAGGHIPGFVISQALAGTANDTTPVDQAGILHSIEQSYGLSYLNSAGNGAHGSLGSELSAGSSDGSVIASESGSATLQVDVSQWAASSERFVARVDDGGSAPIAAVSSPQVVDWSGAATASEPVVTGVCPFATTPGGTQVTITGENLGGATAVHVGAASAAFTVDSATQLTATAPAASAGPVDVTVTSSGGTSQTGSEDRLTYYAAPTVSAVSPSSGPAGGGTSVTVTGTNFVWPATVDFGSVPSASVTVSGPTSITATAPAGAAGVVDVTVTTPGGTSPTGSADRFTYIPAPAVSGVSPPDGPATGGTSVTIAGSNLGGATAVDFGATVASFTVNSATQIIATAPARSAGVIDVTVTTPGGTSPTGSADRFTYFAPPTVTGVSPATGYDPGGTTVTVMGTNLSGATAVDFGGAAATSFSVTSATSLTATAPPGSVGMVDVTVTTQGGTSPTGPSDRFTYLPAPTVTGVSPTSGYIEGGTTVTVTGTNFSGATAVALGHTDVSFVVVSPTEITFTTPVGAAGTLDVTVADPSGTSATGPADRFTYVPPPPATVAAVDPSTGPTTGGSVVTVSGTGFGFATEVTFGSVAASFTIDSPTQLTAVTPAGAVGAVDITVTDPGGTSSTGGDDVFTYEGSGYWMLGDDGSVYALGGAPFEGSLPALGVRVRDIVALVPTADGEGYWMIGADGGVFAFGDAGYVGSLPALGVHVHDVVGAVPTADGGGYWMIGADGGVFAFGDAGYVGSLPGLGVHVGDIVAVVPTADSAGYWMVGADGGVFAFGDAGYVGSLPALGVHVHDVVGAVPTADGGGYWMIGADGGVFAFGDAGYVGSLPGLGVRVHDVVGVVATQDDGGYWMVGADGGVFAFGDAGFVGSLPGMGVFVGDVVGFANQ